MAPPPTSDEAAQRVARAVALIATNARKGLKAAEAALQYCRDAGSAEEGAAVAAVVKAHVSIVDISQAWREKEATLALKKAKEGLNRCTSAGNSLGRGLILASMISAYVVKDELSEALKCAAAAVDVFRSIDDKEHESAVLQLSSGLLIKVGDLEKALAAGQRLAAISVTNSERAVALETIYEAYLEKNDLRKARATAEDLQTVAEATGDMRKVAVTRLMLANLAYSEGEFVEAIALAREAQAMLNDANSPKEEAQSLFFIAEVHLSKKEPELALRAGEKAKRIFQSLGEADLLANVLLVLSQVRLQLLSAARELDRSSSEYRQHATETSRTAEEAVLAARYLDDVTLIARALLLFAQVKTVCLETDISQQAVDEANELFRQTNDDRGIAAALCVQADIHIVNGSSARAVSAADKAIKLYQVMGDEQGIWMARGLKEQVTGVPAIQDSAARDAPAQVQILPPAPAPAPQQTVAKARKKKKQDSGLRLQETNLNPDDVALRLTELVELHGDVDEDVNIEADTPLMQVGVNSRSAVVLRNAIAEELPGVQLPFTLAFDYPTVNALTDLVMESLDVAG